MNALRAGFGEKNALVCLFQAVLVWSKPGSTIWATWAFAQGPLSREGPFAIGYIYIFLFLMAMDVGPGCIGLQLYGEYTCREYTFRKHC